MEDFEVNPPVINLNPYAKHWCFTYNNPTLDEIGIADALNSFPYVYAVYQLEVGEQGTEHFQGYVMFQNRVRLSQVRTLFKAHWSVARATPEQNRAYCTKPDTRVSPPCELGIFPEQQRGKRTDLEPLHVALKAGLTQEQYVDQFFDTWKKYPNLVKHWIEATVQPRDPRDGFTCKLFYGRPGTGKSTLAHYLAHQGDVPVFRHSHGLGRFWDGYIGQRRVIFDDFGGSSLTFGDFKTYIDKFPLRVNIKQSSCPLAANEFYITSNFTPDQWWSQEVTTEDRSAIFRRITEVYFFPEKGKFRQYSSYDQFAHFELNGALAPNLQAEIPPLQEIILNDEEEIQEIRPAL
nr:MAG TPA: Rep protein [Cressdnaviricota sp.]